MGVFDEELTPTVQASYVLAMIVLLDILFPDGDVINLINNIAEGIHEEIIKPSGPSGTEADVADSGGGSEGTAGSDGAPEND